MLLKKLVYKIDRRVRMFLVWTFICGINSLTGLVFGLDDNYNLPAMIIGIVLFIITLTILSFTKIYSMIKDKKFTFIAMWIWYIFSCLALWYHTSVGVFSVVIIKSMGFEKESFIETLLTTILMGLFLNFIAIIVLWVVTRCRDFLSGELKKKYNEKSN